MAKVSTLLDEGVIVRASEGAARILPSNIADKSCFFSLMVLYVDSRESRENIGIHRRNQGIRLIHFDVIKPLAYFCVIVIARESESEPVVHHNRKIGKH